MGFFQRLGNKLSHAYDVGSRIGMKALSVGSRIGHKVSDVGHGFVNAIKESPLGLHPYVAGFTGVADKVLGAVDKGVKFADKSLAVAKDVDKAVMSARSKLEKPSVAPVDAGLQKHSSGMASGSLQQAQVHKAPRMRNRREG